MYRLQVLLALLHALMATLEVTPPGTMAWLCIGRKRCEACRCC